MAHVTPEGWYPDPEARGDHRYWDGNSWTAWISRGGTVHNEADPGTAPTATVPTATGPTVTASQVRGGLGGLLVAIGVVIPGFTFGFNSASWRDVEHGEFPLWAVALGLGVTIIFFAYQERYALVRTLSMGVLAVLALALFLYHDRLGFWMSAKDVVWGNLRVTFGVYAVAGGAVLALIAGRTASGPS